MASAGAANYMDCIGAHYNEGIVSPNQTSGDPAAITIRAISGRWSTPTLALSAARARLFYRTWLCFAGRVRPSAGSFGWGSDTSVAEQATWIAQAVSLARSSGRVRLVIIWNIDFTNYEGDPMAGYAIVRPGGSCRRVMRWPEHASWRILTNRTKCRGGPCVRQGSTHGCSPTRSAKPPYTSFQGRAGLCRRGGACSARAKEFATQMLSFYPLSAHHERGYRRVRDCFVFPLAQWGCHSAVRSERKSKNGVSSMNPDEKWPQPDDKDLSEMPTEVEIPAVTQFSKFPDEIRREQRVRAGRHRPPERSQRDRLLAARADRDRERPGVGRAGAVSAAAFALGCDLR